MNSESLYIKVLSALKRQDYNALSDIIIENSANGNSNNALIFLKSNLPYKDLISINSLASAYLFSYNYDYAEIFSKASLDRANQLNNSGINTENDDFLVCLKDALYLLLKIYLNTGRNQEGIELYVNFYNQYPAVFNNDKFTDVHLEAAEIYLSVGNIEKAGDILFSLNTSDMAAPRLLRYNQLRNKIDQLTSDVTDLPEDLIRQKDKNEDESSKDIVNSLDYFARETGISIDSADLKNLAQQLKSSLESSAKNDDKFNHSTSGFEKVYTFLKGTSANESSHSQDEISYRLQQTQKIFFDEIKGKSKTHLQEAVFTFIELLDECEQNNYQDDINNILWSIYLCYRRMDQYKEAAETLEKLKARLEVTRSSISNINKRAGVFHAFPHLFPGLAEMYFHDGNLEGLFQTVEASKGRNLADKMLIETGKETAGVTNPNSFFELTRLTKQYLFHYLSLFTDEEWSYSILVTAKGKIIADKVRIGSKQLQLWVNKDYANPKSWTSSKLGLLGKKVDLSSSLTPFLKPVEIALNDRLIAINDHITYSPDGYMHLFPLHYIKQTNGCFLIEDFSLSKVHGSMQFIPLLTYQPGKIEKILTVTTSAAGDKEEIVRDFNVVKNILGKNKNSFDVEPTVKDVLQAIGSKQLIHFATHGSFPNPNKEYTDPEQKNPYFSCGLLLCFNNDKPVLNNDFNYYETNNLLSPEILIDSKLNLKDTHVSMQACVSGHSKEGVAGDALGLEWALFSSGVASLISANWNITVGTSNKFFIKFYYYWLDQKLSKSQAYRFAVLDLMKNEVGEFLNVFEWGGLTLSGDFR